MAAQHENDLSLQGREQQKRSLQEIALVFLKLGCFGFGGPAVHIAMMEEEIVRRRRWLTAAHFLDLVGATNLIPGPNSTEMSMHCGHERAGWKGLVVAGLCFILPAVIITGVLAWAYQRYGQLPAVQPFLYGIKPAIIAVVVSLMVVLGRKALKTIQLGIIGIAAIVLALAGVNELYILFGAGLLSMLLLALKGSNSAVPVLFPVAWLQIASGSIYSGQFKIFWSFLKIGAMLYGSGYVLFAFLDAELVTTGQLTRQQLTDAIAVGQFTPGPVFSAATFIGWQLAGLPGAVAATIGIFLPSFLLVWLLNPLIPLLRKSPYMTEFLDAVNMVSVSLILVVCFEMGKSAIIDWRSISIALVSLVIVMTFKKINTAWIVGGGALLGYLLSLV